MTTTARDPIYAGYRYPAEIISYAVWLYFRFPLSLRMVEEMLAARGISVTHETIRQWASTSAGALSRKLGREPPAYRGECRHGSALLPPPSFPARDHPVRDLALSPLHAELPRCRGAAGRERARHLVRNGAALAGPTPRRRASNSGASRASPRTSSARHD